MTALLLEVGVTSYEDFIYLCQGDDIFCTLERIESLSNSLYNRLQANQLLIRLLLPKAFDIDIARRPIGPAPRIKTS